MSRYKIRDDGELCLPLEVKQENLSLLPSWLGMWFRVSCLCYRRCSCFPPAGHLLLPGRGSCSRTVGERWEQRQLPAHALSSILALELRQEKCLRCSVAEETQPRVG